MDGGIEIIPSSDAGTLGLPTGVSTGNFSFTGGAGPANSQTLMQTIGVGSLAARIDEGKINSNFNILLQSRQSGTVDFARTTIQFLDASGGILSSYLIVDDYHPNNVDVWQPFSQNAVLPIGTRNVSIILEATRTAGFSSDGCFDNVSFKLTSSTAAVPEPGTLALLVGIVFFGNSMLLRRRRK